MLRALLTALVLLAAAPAAASEKGIPTGPGQVDMAPIGIPIIADGKVRNYVFVQVRLITASGYDPLALKAKEPWYRDAIVRYAHRKPFTKPNDWTTVDEPRFKAVLLAEARRISGAKAFTGVEIRNQAPRRRTGMIRPGAGAR